MLQEKTKAVRQHRLNVPDTSPHSAYHIEISDTAYDPEWDTFLWHAPYGIHVQTSLWGQIKILAGGHVVRVVVRHREHIVAGGQILLRPLSVAGAIGYVPRGPVIGVDDPALPKLVIDALHEAARSRHVHLLIVQPPYSPAGLALEQQLPAWGFQPGTVNVSPSATVAVDLAPNEDDILAQMHKRTRKTIRRGVRGDISVRVGTRADLTQFHQLYIANSQRNNFTAYPLEYFENLWLVLGHHGYMLLTLAEYHGEPVSAKLQIAFGDTVVSKAFGWSGEHGQQQPNEVLSWESIRIAKARGYRYYDFEGINREAAEAITNGEPLPEHLQQTATSYKLGYSKLVWLFPRPYSYVYNPVLRWGYHTIVPKITTSPMFHRLLSYVRAR